jgi:hypothetical protein
MKANFGSEYGWSFQSPAFEALDPVVCFLSEPFRQGEDAAFAGLLDRVRKGDTSVVSALNSRAGLSIPDHVPWLCARKAAAEDRNLRGLERLGVKIYELRPIITGEPQKIPADLRNPVRLGIGARVMITRNAKADEGGYVNGSTGTLIEFASTCSRCGYSKPPDKNDVCPGCKSVREPRLIVKLDDGSRASIRRVETEVVAYEVNEKTKRPERVVVASVSQFPVILGWAFTIHKAQGLTLNSAALDLGRGAFAHGQTYVALSRCRDLNGLYLTRPLDEADIIIDRTVEEWGAKFFQSEGARLLERVEQPSGAWGGTG